MKFKLTRNKPNLLWFLPKNSMGGDITIRIPKKAIQLVVGLFLIGLALLFVAVTLASYSALRNPLDFLMIGGLLGLLGVACIFWDSKLAKVR